MIELKNISRTYVMGRETVRALQDVSLKVGAGEFVAIMGPSGSGKSTLMHILGFLDRPAQGSYFLSGRDVSRLSDDQLAVLRNHFVGFVFQQFHLLPRFTAVENVALPLMYAGKHELTQVALDKIREVGLADRAGHQPNELSGGERQRVAMARSMVKDPLILLADEPTGNLDAKSEAEVMAIFNDLHARGKTIVVVTHELKVAKFAQRIITMDGGKIISDDRKTSDFPKTAEKIDLDLEVGRAKFGGQIRQAIKSIASHKMRSFLSMLGILIGTAAVIAMLALGRGAEESLAQQMASMGTNLLMLQAGPGMVRTAAENKDLFTFFTMEDAEAIRHLREVKGVSENISRRGQVVFKNKNWNTQVQGEGADYASMHASIPVSGYFFTEAQLRSLQKVAVLGKTVVREIFGNANPVGQTIKINRVHFQVIGVLPAKGTIGFFDQDDVIIIPVTTALFRLFGNQPLESMSIEIKDPGLMEQAQDSVKRLIIQRHHLAGDWKDSFWIGNMAQARKIMATTAQTMNLFLAAIAAISLLVGGIGIMNIMLVSVTERTREIGLRKAIGARKSDIRTQFLIESVLMSFSGGLIGIGVGVGAAVALSLSAGWPTKVTMASILMATTISVMIGILFGLRPAMQAAELDPVEALRYE